jgi:hypothetical protein
MAEIPKAYNQKIDLDNLEEFEYNNSQLKTILWKLTENL